MDARPILLEVARALREKGLEVVLIGNSAAAVQGAPVTTLDIDFMMRRTPANIARLKRVAEALGAVVFTPFYPVSGLFRVMRDCDALQLDFMTVIHGVRSFNSLRSRAVEMDLGGEKILVAGLVDIINSKRAADRPQDRAVLNVLEATLKQKQEEAQPGRDSGGSQKGK